MSHVKQLSISLLILTFVISGCGQNSAVSVTNPTQAPKAEHNSSTILPANQPSVHTLLDANKRITENAVMLQPQAHKQSKTEKKLRKSIPWADFSVPILEMHDTVAIPGDPYTMSPAQFDQEMSWLKSHGFHTVTLDDVYAAIYHGRTLLPRSIVLTFDDGYESNFTTATPILKKYGFVATEFMVSGFVNRPGFLTASELQQMQSSHIWQIESHTVTHPDLRKLKAEKIAQQVTQAKVDLSKLVGAPVNYFAYPYGSYNGKVLRALLHDGYLLAVSTRQGYANPSIDGPLLLNRIAVHQGLSIETFASLLTPSLTPNRQQA